MSESVKKQEAASEDTILNKIAEKLKELDKPHALLAFEAGLLTDSKNKAYGDSFGQASEILKVLYPNGIPIESYTDALCITRIIDKLFRLATHKNYNNENVYADILGYALLGLMKDRNQSLKNGEEYSSNITERVNNLK